MSTPDAIGEMSGPGHPTVSVIVPTYNRASLLGRAIESVIGQTSGGWELIVVDDGLTDGTRTYLDTVTDARLRTVLTAHTGVISTVRNTGASLARGAWLAFLDSDDAWLPDKLKIQLAALAASPECGWGYTRYEVTDLDGRVLRSPAVEASRAHAGWILPALLTVEAKVATSTVMVKRELFETVGGYDPSYARGEDYELYFRLGALSPASAVADALVQIRKHAQQVQQGDGDPHQNFARMYLEVRARTTDEEIARLCLEQCAGRHVSAATLQSRRGNHRAAFDGLGRALSYARPSRRWCAAAAACAWRALTMRS